MPSAISLQLQQRKQLHDRAASHRQDPAGPHLLHEWLTNPNVPAELRQAAQQKAAELFAQSAEDEAYDDLLTADDILTTDWPEPRWAIPKLMPIGLSIL